MLLPVLARAGYPATRRLAGALTATAAVALAPACGKQRASNEAAPSPVPSGARPLAGSPQLPAELAPRPSASAPRAIRQEPVAWNGPWFTVTNAAAAAYAAPRFDKEQKLGYARSGGRIPVKGEIVSRESCSGGWYAVVDGGFVCGNQGTISGDDPRLKFTTTPPNLGEVLPYRYARNAKNGTPLYKSIPSPEQMQTYEPYLTKPDSERKDDGEAERAEPDGASARRSAPPAAEGDAGAAAESALRPASTTEPASLPTEEAEVEEPPKPWWAEDDAGTKLHEVTLERMREEADGVLEMRMMRGFYVAVDKTFRWNGRLWYKTTKGLVAPADRLWQVDGPKFKGVELEGELRLPIGWVPGSRKNTTAYALDGDRLEPKRTVEQFSSIRLSGNTREVSKAKYWETQDGLWVKDAHLRVTQPGEPPADVGAEERWVDVNLTQQTLVLFQGKTPVYATLLSSGKKSKIKDKDHRTPQGSWRIREKHVATTMDGDGTAAGDLPYSIEDVPYVMYFHQSYALHGAFWHRNFGMEMSHGCVNLAPLDAKWLFFFLDPQLPRGWHGVWSSPDRPGSRVIVHE